MILSSYQETNVYLTFLQISYRFYSIFALGLVVIVSVMMRDFGSIMRRRARTTGRCWDGAVPWLIPPPRT